jgi:hypothetical protein
MCALKVLASRLCMIFACLRGGSDCVCAWCFEWRSCLVYGARCPNSLPPSRTHTHTHTLLCTRPGWAWFQPIAQKMLYDYYGSTAVVSESYAPLVAFVDLLHSRANGYILKNGLGDWSTLEKVSLASSATGAVPSSVARCPPCVYDHGLAELAVSLLTLVPFREPAYLLSAPHIPVYVCCCCLVMFWRGGGSFESPLRRVWW